MKSTVHASFLALAVPTAYRDDNSPPAPPPYAAFETNVGTFPADFFNVSSKRGAVLTTLGTGLRVDSTDFAAVNAGLGAQFTSFSIRRLFMPVGSNQVDVDFKLVGTTTSGVVNGFGVVFCDVDRRGSATVGFFDTHDVRIAVLVAPNHGGGQLLSFIGAVFTSPIIARVRITSGDAAPIATITDVSAGGRQRPRRDGRFRL